MKIQTLVCLLACLGLVTSEAQYYCGSRLSDALDFVCEGNLIKRSAPQQNALEPRWPWLPTVDASRARALGDRRKRGVVDECCLKPCTVKELATYCA